MQARSFLAAGVLLGTLLALAAACATDATEPDAATAVDVDPTQLERFSFFVTSLASLVELSGSDAGFGGDLRFGETGPGAGLRGADRICATIAERSLPGAAAKEWRAFLSAVDDGTGRQVDAIDRIGEGPWYDRVGRLLANDKSELLQNRPLNAHPIIKNDLPNEWGVPNHQPDPTKPPVDNHDTLTGSDDQGRLYSPTATCKDWTAAQGDTDTEGQPRVGHSWPLKVTGPSGGTGRYDLASWMSFLTEAGCKPGINLVDDGGKRVKSRREEGQVYTLDTWRVARHASSMPRPLRLDYPGAWHHVMHRGARRAPIFRDDLDATIFFDALQEAVERFRIEVHAYALMPNHYHLLVRSPHATLSRAMRHVNGVFTQRLNQRSRWDGPIFRGRFTSQLVECDDYLEVLVAYLHLNPVRAHLVARPEDECWTSHRAYLGLEEPRPWLSRDEMLARFGSGDALHRYVRDVHEGATPWPDGFEVTRGWLPPPPEEPARPERPANAAPLDTEAVLERVTRVTGAPREQLMSASRGPRANPARRFAVWALRHATLLSQTQIGRILGMTPPHVARILATVGRTPPEPVATWIRSWETQGGEEGAA